MHERRITGLGLNRVTAYFFPTEMMQGGEGNFSFGNGVVTMNYGNPPYLNALGGFLKTASPRFAHEYAHELFGEIHPLYLGGSACLNEGIADALAFVSGHLPADEFGPVGVRGSNFETDGCLTQTATHDIGNCPLWHINVKNQLTETFIRGLFRPRRAYNFDSCSLSDIRTGNSLLVLFTEAAEGADVRPALDAAGIPHANTYAEALAALGF